MFDIVAAIGGAVGAAWLFSYSLPGRRYSVTEVAIRLFVSVSVAVINTRPAIDLVNRFSSLEIGPDDHEYVALVGSVLGFFAHAMVGILDITRQRLRGKDVFEVLTDLRRRKFDPRRQDKNGDPR